MLPLRFKLLLFLCLWHEIAGQFQLGIDAAFMATMFVFCGGAFVRSFGVELAGLSDALTGELFVRGVLWLVCYGWLAPAVLWNLPVSVTAAAVIALVLAGVRGRQHCETAGYALDKSLFRAHSDAVGVGLVAALAASFTAQRQWGSVLPLVGYVALIFLPVSLGWMGAAPRPNRHHDARFGDEDMFHDVGASDEY